MIKKTISVDDISTVELQRLMQTAVAPRPIALASTIDKDGSPNLSPFSFFNMVSTRPPILVFSPSRRVRDTTVKHTLENLREVKEVVIGIVNYPIVQQVSLSSTEYEKGVNEFIKSGLTPKKADFIRPQLIEECPVNFECVVNDIIELGKEGGSGNLVIAEVKKIHLDPTYLDDNGNLVQAKLDLVARLGGNFYSRQNENSLFEVPKPLTTLGIGIDQLPKEIRTSRILSGNDLGMLANIEELPKEPCASDEKIHLKAKELLENNQISEAWELLSNPS